MLDLHRMLDRYLSHFAHSEKGNATKERHQAADQDNGEDGDEDEEDVLDPSERKENRRWRRFLIKCGIAFAIAVVFVVGGAMVAILAHEHMADNGVFKVIMTTAIELIKIIFPAK